MTVRILTVLLLLVGFGCTKPEAPAPKVEAPVVVQSIPQAKTVPNVLKKQDRYDEHLQKYAKQYFSRVADWKWFKAQTRQESAFNPNAVSPVGARGLMQLMPFTSRQIARELGISDMPVNPAVNIHMGVYYDRKMWGIFTKEAGIERLRFMFGSYNAGAGNILKAQKRASMDGLNTTEWASIACKLPLVTGKHSAETIGYVRNIERFYAGILR
jgi:membrane-bound lytic murein transglycosylase F